LPSYGQQDEQSKPVSNSIQSWIGSIGIAALRENRTLNGRAQLVSYVTEEYRSLIEGIIVRDERMTETG
jgi:hypothetical protein